MSSRNSLVLPISIAALLLAAVSIAAVFVLPGLIGTQGKYTTPYNPTTQTRSVNLLVIPDVGGDGYDAFSPGVVTVNQGDTVAISVRNLDPMQHGIGVDAFKVNTVIQPATKDAAGNVTPVVTTVPSFVASTPGVYTIWCTIPCGAGHLEMKATLVVLPTG